MPQPRMRSVRGKLPQPLADGLRAFAKAHPECEGDEYASLYLAALTCAILIDTSPSAALLREYSIANSKLRRAVLGEDAAPKEQSLADIINGA